MIATVEILMMKSPLILFEFGPLALLVHYLQSKEHALILINRGLGVRIVTSHRARYEAGTRIGPLSAPKSRVSRLLEFAAQKFAGRS